LSRRATAGIIAACIIAKAHAAEFDGGGRIGDYLQLVAAREYTTRIEITGVCASACTIKLGARHACVHADARLLFHAARDADGRVDRLATLMMLHEYPARIRAWAKRRSALDSQDFTAMTGAEAIALGVANCDASQR
jgi:hypothetical protein